MRVTPHPHPAEPGHTGMTCEKLYEDADGYGDTCGQRVRHPIHVQPGDRIKTKLGRVYARWDGLTGTVVGIDLGLIQVRLDNPPDCVMRPWRFPVAWDELEILP